GGIMRKRKHAFAALVVAIAATAVVLAAGAGAGSAKPNATFKVAWIYVGPHNDGGWSQAHDAGRLYVQKALGSKVQTTYKENIAVGAQLKQTVASLVNQGYKMIFGTSYGYFDKALAAKYPQVDFEQATGTDTATNLSEYFGAAEDTVFLSGMAAGAATKSGNIGYVVAFPIPEVIRHANAFALGAQVTHPGAKVHLVWTNSWYDPAKEKKAAESLVAAGADVLGHRGEEAGDRERLVLRVHRPAVRPGRQVARAEGPADAGPERRHEQPVRHELAREGRDRQPEGLVTVQDEKDRRGAQSAPPPAAVVMRGIVKRFPGVLANDRVDFEAAAGEVHALLGENGAGKSTLSNILTGLYRPDAGEIFLHGEPVQFHSPRDALDARIFMVHQHFRLVEPFTVAENVVLGDHRGEGRTFRLRHRAIEQRVAELSKRYRLAG